MLAKVLGTIKYKLEPQTNCNMLVPIFVDDVIVL